MKLSILQSHDETFCLYETKCALDIVISRLRQHHDHECLLGKATSLINRGNLFGSLKELNVLCDSHDLIHNEVLVDLLYQAWESYAQYRHFRTQRAKLWGTASTLIKCQEKAQDCKRGRLEVWHWQQDLFSKNSPIYSSKALALLQRVPLFKDDRVLPNMLAHYMQRRTIPKDRLIWKDFAVSEGIYFLECGEVVIYDIHNNNDEMTIAAGNYFGEGPVMFGTRHNNYCRATEECTLYVIDANLFTSLVDKFEGVKHRLVLDSVKHAKSSQSIAS